MLKTKLKTIFIAVLVFIAVFIVNQFFIPDKYVLRLFSKTGTIRIESIPKTSIFINSGFVGQTPLQINLKTGVYTVKLVPESNEADLISWSSEVRVFENTTTFINRELANKDIYSSGEILSLEKGTGEKAQIWINTEPSGLFVSLDGEDRGISPMFMDNVTQGSHELTVRGEGFVPRTIKINVINGYKLMADFKLMIDKDYEKKDEDKKKKPPAKKTTQKLRILETSTGWLRVREAPSLNASESAQVLPGEEFTYLEEQNNWYQIEYELDKLGWVLGDYVEIIDSQEPTPTLDEPTPTPQEAEEEI